jgi:hypothetical protein
MTRKRAWKLNGKLRKISSIMVECLSPICPNLLTSYPAEPLTEEELEQKEAYIEDGFPDWSRRDFQQFVRALETYGW